MSDFEDETFSNHVHRRKKKKGAQNRKAASLINSSANEESDDDYDETGSYFTSFSLDNDDRSSRDGTPVNGERTRGKRGRQKSHKACKLQYKCVATYKEEHGHPLFSIQINTHSQELDPQLFATVGGNRISIYQLLPDEVNLLHCLSDPATDEHFYTCSWSYCRVKHEPRLAVAGQRGVIRIVSPVAKSFVCTLLGHGCAVNELQYHPSETDLLFSASKDYSIRLWNTRTRVMVALFSGVDGHRDEVLSLDVKPDATAMVTCGMDHSLKIWDLTVPELVKSIEDSFLHDEDASQRVFQTLFSLYPDFSTRDVHRNYVDCVRWYGDLLLSKSCENSIVCWKPGELMEENIHKAGEKVTVLHTFNIKDCDIWFMRFSLDFSRQVLSCGNQTGRIYVFDLDIDDPSHCKFTVLSQIRSNAAVRQTAMSRNGKVLLCATDDGEFWRFERL